MRRAWALHLFLAAACASLAAVSFAPVVSFHGVYDDAFVLCSPDVCRPWTAAALRHDNWGSMLNTATSNQQWRPLSTASLRLTLVLHGCGADETEGGRLLSGRDVCDSPPPRCTAALHAGTLILHAACAAAQYALGVALFRLPPTSAALSAALFAAHPVHAESVATVYGRADVQALLATQAALLAGSSGASGGAVDVLRLLLSLAAALSKETGVVAFLLLPIADALLSRRIRPVWAAACVALAAAFVMTRAVLVVPWGPPLGFVDSPAALLRSRASRAASFAWLHWRYVEALALPWRLAVNHGWDSGTLVDSPASDARLLLPVTLYAVLSILLVRLSRAAARERTGAKGPAGGGIGSGVGGEASAALFCVLWGTLAFAPSSNLLFTVGTTLGERLLYGPSAPFCTLAALAVRFAARRLAPALLPAASAAAAVALLSLLASRCRAEAAPYACDARLWASAAARYPSNVVALHNLAVARDAAGDHAAALQLYNRVEDVWLGAEAVGGVASRVAEDLSPANSGMRRAVRGRAAVLRPLLRGAAVDPGWRRAAGGAADATAPPSLDDAAAAIGGYVEALNGGPEGALRGRLLSRIVTLCEAHTWPMAGTRVCAQAAAALAGLARDEAGGGGGRG